MFAEKFDALKRQEKKANRPITLLSTCQQGTDDYYMWMNFYVWPGNDTVEYILESDGLTYSFYTRAHLDAHKDTVTDVNNKEDKVEAA
jgi:hypothetical protein